MKPCIKKFSLLIGFLLTLFILTLTISIKAEATGSELPAEGTPDADGGGNTEATGNTGLIGATPRRMGFMFYFVDASEQSKETGNYGKPISPPILITHSDEMYYKYLSNNNMEFNLFAKDHTNLASQGKVIMIDHSAPSPVEHNVGWKGNGLAVTDYLLKKGDLDHSGTNLTNFEYISQQAFKDRMPEVWENITNTGVENLAIVVEPIAALTIRNDGNYKVASVDGWAMWLNGTGIYDGSHSFLSFSFPNCMALEFDKTEFGPHFLKPISLNKNWTYAEMLSTGVGVHLIFFSDTQEGATHTWDAQNHPTNEDLAPLPPANSPNSANIFTIIKSYRVKNSNGTFIDRGTYIRNNTVKDIIIEDETLGSTSDKKYKVIGWKISSTPKPSNLNAINWESKVPGSIHSSGTTKGTVQLPSTHRYLYVLLESTNTETMQTGINYKISESVIARCIRLSKPDAWLNLPDITKFDHTWTRNAVSGSCVGHPNPTPTNPNNTDSCTSWSWSDVSITIGLKPYFHSSCENIVATRENWKARITRTTDVTKWGTTVENEGESKPLGDHSDNDNYIKKGHGLANDDKDLVCVIHRGQDKLTLADWKNVAAGNGSTSGEGLANLSSGSYAISNIPIAGRKTAYYTDQFSLGIVDDSDDEKVAIKGNKSDDCKGSTNYALSILPQEGKENNFNVKVGIEAYSGSATAATNDTSIKSDKMLTFGSSGNIECSGAMTNIGSFSVYPYIQMQYYPYGNVTTLAQANSPRVAYVLGIHKRTLTLNGYGEIKWSRSSTPNITLDTLQWSTHQTAAEHHEFGTVLPGGATLTLTIKDSDRQKIQIKSYQPILIGAGATQVTSTGNTIPTEMTLTSATTAHNNFVNSVINDLESLTFQQWWLPDEIDNNSPDTVSVWSDGGLAVNNGVTLPNVTDHSVGDTCSNEEKYYFKSITTSQDTSADDQGDLDTICDNTGVELMTEVKIENVSAKKVFT